LYHVEKARIAEERSRLRGCRVTQPVFPIIRCFQVPGTTRRGYTFRRYVSVRIFFILFVPLGFLMREESSCIGSEHVVTVVQSRLQGILGFLLWCGSIPTVWSLWEFSRRVSTADKLLLFYAIDYLPDRAQVAGSCQL
jgi:hypothetical protein